MCLDFGEWDTMKTEREMLDEVISTLNDIDAKIEKLQKRIVSHGENIDRLKNDIDYWGRQVNRIKI